MLVIWGISETIEEAEVIMSGSSEMPLASIIGSRLRDGVAQHLPETPRRRVARWLQAGASVTSSLPAAGRSS